MCEVRSVDGWTIYQRFMVKPLLLLLLLVAAALLMACGQVITPQPTRPSSPTETATAPPSRPTYASTRERSSVSLPDTMTPTVTPTPIVHVVQQGDTLQAIAFDFGVSVEAIQRANGIEKPQFLQVGQRLVIPVDEEADQTTAGLLLPTPTPQPLQVQGVALYETPVDSLLSLGEVVNTTSITVTNVQVQITLLDAANEPLVETDVFVSRDILPPGTRSPFSILFVDPPGTWVAYQVKVIRGQEAGALASTYVPMTVLEAEGSPSGPQFQVNGAVENASATKVAEFVDVIVTTYDAEGAVTGFRRDPLPPGVLDGGVPPGETVPFSLTLTAHRSAPSDFAVAAVGRAVNGSASGG